MDKHKRSVVRNVDNTRVNGRVDFKNSAKNPLGRKEVTFYNPKNDKMLIQNYLDMEDLIIPVILREDENGNTMFAMQYEYIPATKRVHLELPDCPFFNQKKDNYSFSDDLDCVDERMSVLGLDMIGFKYLDSSNTAVSPSFTNQIAKIVTVYVEGDNNIDLKWFPITGLRDYLDNVERYSSLQTKYALELFYEKYKEVIKQKDATSFEYNEELLGEAISGWKDKKNIMPHKYRFGVELSENEDKDYEEGVVDLGQVGEYGLSKESAQCLIARKIGNKVKIGLSKQQRSPFIEREGIGESFYEIAGGMLEKDETYEEAAIRETREETGLKTGNGELIYLGGPFIESKATEEYTAFYLYETNELIIGNQELDKGENIEEMEWFDLEEIDIEKLQAPIPTKYAIVKAKQYYSKIKEMHREVKENDGEDNER